ncbi:MAG: pyrroloquinoline quinone biosynthesis peptide chaperone PqqD [Candidatus Baltobacteraceae bacterium]
MTPEARPRLGKGIKLRHDGDGSVMLLVPEGALILNQSAAAALELVDGERTLSEIVETIVERFDVAPEAARDELGTLFDRLAQRGFVLP